MKFFYLIFSFLALTKAQISTVQNVKLTPIQYEESKSVKVSWDAPANTGTGNAGDLKYEVKSCEISTPKCKNYGTITGTSQDMKNFDISRGQIYTYHIKAVGKDGTKGEEALDLIKFQKRDTCPEKFFQCEKVNQCLETFKTCDGLQGCRDNSDETLHSNCELPSAPDGIRFDDIQETSITIKYSQLGQRDRVNRYKFEVVTASTDKLFTTKTISHIKFETKPQITKFEGLKPGTEYQFRVAAINPSGQGAWSETVTLKTDGEAPTTTIISKVTNVKVEPKKLEESTSVIITWDAPTENGDAVDKYTFSYCKINQASTCRDVSESSTRRIEVTGLEQTLYTLHINTMAKDGTLGTEFAEPFKPAKKRTCPSEQFTCSKIDKCISKEKTCNLLVDCSDKSDEGIDAGCSKPEHIPSKISLVLVKSTGFTIKFTQVSNSDRPKKYEIYVEDLTTKKSFTKKITHETYGRPDVSVKIEGLAIETEYQVRIRTVNQVGAGEWSQYFNVKTETFGPVLNVQVTPVEFRESSAFVISWESPHGLEGKGFSYQVTYCRINKIDTCKSTEKTTERRVEVSGLNDDDIYQWEVKIFDAENNPGKPIQDTYKTKKRDICTTDQFRCLHSPQCVAKNRLCNSIGDCGDKSDEASGAGCNLPNSTPRNIKTTKKGSTYIFTFSNFQGSERITKYEVQVLDTSTNKIFISSSKTHNYLSGPTVRFELDGLRTDRKYDITFRGINPTGKGEWSSPVSVGENSGKGIIKKTTQVPPRGSGSDSNKGDDGMSTAQTAGIAIGIILALIIIIIIIVIILKNRKSKSSSSGQQQKYANGKTNNGYEMDRRP